MSFDALVIGGSYAGLSAAMQLARARKRVLVIDAGAPRNRFANTSHGFLGQDGRAPAAIISDAARQLAAYPSVTFLQHEVSAAEKTSDGFVVTLADGATQRGRRLILATGVKDDLTALPGLRERWGHTVLHCPYCHGYEVAGHPMGVMALSPISAHQAAIIPDWGPTTYFTQGAFEPDDEAAAVLGQRGVSIERTPVVELLGAPPGLEAVRLVDARVIPVRALFIAPRTQMASSLPEQLGCQFDDGPTGQYVHADTWGQTTVPGVFVAGDAASPLSNATLASASGVAAGVGAHQSMIRDR